MVWISNNSLRIAHSYKIYDSLGININYSERKNRFATKQIRLKYDDINPEFIIKEAIKLKKEQINFNNKNRIKELLIKEVGSINCDKIRKKINRQINNKANRIIKELKNNNCYNFIDGNLEYGFLDDNMSLTSLAKMIGRKSKSTSANMLKRMEELKMIKKERRIEFIQPLDCFTNLREINNYTNFPLVIKNKYGIKWLAFSLPSLITII